MGSLDEMNPIDPFKPSFSRHFKPLKPIQSTDFLGFYEVHRKTATELQQAYLEFFKVGNVLLKIACLQFRLFHLPAHFLFWAGLVHSPLTTVRKVAMPH
jgi:hypothetical protein